MRRFVTALFSVWLLLPGLPGTAPKAQPVHRPEADSLLRVLAGSRADTNRVKALLRLGEYQVYKPGEFKADMDSARVYALQAQDLSRMLGYYPGEVRSLHLLGTISREAKDYPRALAYQQQAIHLGRLYNDVPAQAESYRLLAHAMRDKGDAAGARRQVQKAIDLTTRRGYLSQAAEAYLELGNTYANHGEELKKKISCYRQGLQTFAQAGNTRRQADVGKDLGDLYMLDGNDAQALIELRKALDLYRSIRYRHLQGVYDLLGNVSTSIGAYQEGLEYGLQAVRTAEALRDSSLQLCTIYNRVGVTYYVLKQYPKAHAYFAKSLRVAQKYNDRASVLLVTGNIANVLNKLNQFEKALSLLLTTARRYPPEHFSDSIVLAEGLLESYTRLKQFGPAQRYCDQLLAMSGKLDENNEDQNKIYGHAIKFFLASKQYAQARTYLDKLEKSTKERHDSFAASFFHLWHFQLDSLQGNYPSAIKHYQLYKRLEDSLFNETKSRQIAALDVLHETERKEKDLLLKEQSIKALTRERQLQAEQIGRDELVRNGVVGGAALLLVLLAVIYNRYRLKRRSNQQLEAQQRQLQTQQQALLAQHQELQAQQAEINRKNEHLSQLLGEKDSLLGQKDTLIGEKEGLLSEKDHLLAEQQRLLQEKERLLKEIHHRVKNNLQVVMSLLNLQADSLQDKAALSAIQESQHRVQAMALIHQKLYQAQGVARIPMQDYIGEVVAYLHESYCLHQQVRFCVEVEPVELDVTQAVPLGLIINEAITNAFKYAFPGGRPGTITLRLRRLGERTCHLTIADDGVGLPQDHDPSQSHSLGMTLLHGFSGQLGGELTLTSPPGLSIDLVFEEELLSPVFAPVAQGR